MSRLRPSSQDEVGAVLSCALKYNFSGYLGLLGQAIRAGGEMAWGEDARCPRQNFSTARPQQDAAVIILGPSFIQTSKPPFRYKLTSNRLQDLFYATQLSSGNIPLTSTSGRCASLKPTICTMSFGYSVTDLVSLTTLSWKLYKSCKSAPNSFASLSSEVLSLHAVLREAEEALFPGGQSHDDCRAGKSACKAPAALPPSAQENLRVIADGCNGVLVDLQSLIDRYESLGRKKYNAWRRVKWGAEDIAELRSRLASNVSMLNTFVSISQFTVQQKLDRYTSMHKMGNRESSLISEQTADSLSSHDKLTWRTIRKELEEIGITVAAFDANREFILNWFAEAVESDTFQPWEVADTDSTGDDTDSDHATLHETSRFVAFQQGVSMDPKEAASPPPFPRSTFKTRLRTSSTLQSLQDKKSDRRKPYSSTSPAFSEEASRKTSLLASVKSRNISAVRKFLKTSPGHLTPETYIITLQTAISLGDHAILELLLTSRPPSYPLPLDNKIYINSLLATSFDGKFSISTSQITQKTKHPSNPTSPSSLKQPPSAAAPTSSYPSCPTTTTALTTLPPLPTHTISFPPSAPQQHKAIRTSSAISSLAAASFKGHTEIVGLLLRHNADPNARGYQFGSALQAAALQGHAEIVRLLVDGGADVGLEGGKYGTALKAARHRGHEEVVRVLVEGVKTVDEDGSARRG
ncbi:hypothetical protein BDFG_03821 [Blastomyces dermatitidis ATCC 26199]|nr:hypothetical protein BDFG_03821 [Blastomyces dermatitidis ATCC 26199]